MNDVEIVAATAGDVRSLARERSADETTLRLALEAADAGGVWAARDGGETIGWAVAQRFEGSTLVGDVFVVPSFRRRGVGGRLLDAAFYGADDVSRWLAFDPRDSAAFALAARLRLAPIAVLLRLAGPIPREDALLAMAASSYRFDVDTIAVQAHRFALDELDRSTIGVGRPEMHRRYAGEGLGLAFFSGGEFVGYAYVWQDGRIGPFAAASAAYANQMLAYAMLTLQRSSGASWCSALIPAAALRLVNAALHAGLRIEETIVLGGDVPAPDLSRYVARDRLAL